MRKEGFNTNQLDGISDLLEELQITLLRVPKPEKKTFGKANKENEEERECTKKIYESFANVYYLKYKRRNR